jgi:hypothetical protein
MDTGFLKSRQADRGPLMIFQSITSRPVIAYCALLAVLGGAFLIFVVLSFRLYTREVETDNLVAQTQEARWKCVALLLSVVLNYQSQIEKEES